jgi:hypothetical protein
MAVGELLLISYDVLGILLKDVLNLLLEVDVR